LASSTLPTDILVIDNASSDDTLNYIRQHFKRVELIASEVNLGFGQANNLGFSKFLSGTYEYAFLLNQDARIADNTLQQLVEVAEAHPKFGIISPMHLNGDGSALDEHFSNYISPIHCKNLYSDVFLGKAKDSYACDFVNAAAWLLTRSCVEVVGGFSPSFFHYGEDDNYCHRALWHQFSIGVVPTSYIYHDRSTKAMLSKEEQWYNILNTFKVSFSNPFYTKNSLYFVGHLMKYAIKVPRYTREIFKTIFSFPYGQLLSNREKSKVAGAFLAKGEATTAGADFGMTAEIQIQNNV